MVTTCTGGRREGRGPAECNERCAGAPGRGAPGSTSTRADELETHRPFRGVAKHHRRDLTRFANVARHAMLGKHGGAGGGIRTHEGFRPETCQVSAFTSFATPAPHRLRTEVSTRPRRETCHALPCRGRQGRGRTGRLR